MQNVKCKIQNEGMDERPYFFIIYKVNTIILHFAFCIQHSGNSPVNYNLSSCIKYSISFSKTFCKTFDFFPILEYNISATRSDSRGRMPKGSG